MFVFKARFNLKSLLLWDELGPHCAPLWIVEREVVDVNIAET